jgi:DNA polymerase-3 subunit gamma/tau
LPEQALYLKWRPLSFDDVVGQEHIVRTLKNSLKTGRIRHAYLFSGPRGTGKTTCARLLAKAVNCQGEDPDNRPCNNCHACLAVNEGRYLDLIEIDAATHTGVDDVRDLRDKIAFSPSEGRYKVYIIDEVHRFTGNAFDALLKTLEEPPDHAIFVLATTEIDKVPATIKSRCLQFEFRRLSLQELTDRLALITSNEGIHVERAALEVIDRQGTGSVRDSISLLDQIVADPDEEITLDLVQRILGTANTEAVKELVQALVDGHVGRGLHVINAAVDAGSDPRQFGQQVVEHLRAILLAQTASANLVEASEADRALYEQQANQISRGTLLAAIRAFNSAINNYRGGWQPQLALELALIEGLRQPEDDYIRQAPPAAIKAQTQPTSKPDIVPDEPVIEETPPGAPPVVSPSAIQERWRDLLKVLYRYSKSGPGVLEHFRVLRVDGNLLTICTDNQLYFDRLNMQTEKLSVIQRALYDVHQVQLRVKVALVDSMGQMDNHQIPPDDMDDPVIRLALDELGGQIKDDDEDD